MLASSRRSRLRASLAILAFLLALPAAHAAPPSAAGAAASHPGGLEEPAALEPLKYRLAGPAWGGRVARAAGVPGDPNVYFAATASGGVWRSTDGGIHWKPVFDDQPISSTGSIAIAPSDPNVVYVGSGEANIRGNVGSGNGIYRSTDGGTTWKHVWDQKGQIGTMAVDPKDPDVAFAAVLGHAFGPNPERGVYRTTDGGETWKAVLQKDAKTGASDVAIDPSNPRIVFAGLWQAVRHPWGMTSGGPGSGLYVSHDGGDTWKQLTGNGLPDGDWGKVGVAVAPSDGQRVYALIEAEEGGLFRSDDGGEHWERVSADRRLRQRAWYYTTLTVSPVDPDTVWCPQVALLKSLDGGKTFDFVEGAHHGDNHDVWIDPEDPQRIIVANDGGLDISTDGGASWYTPPLPLGQLYHVSVDDQVPFRVAGALQDIGTAQAPSNTFSSAGIRNTDWYDVGGGEAGWVVSDPADPAIVYAGEYGGYISRYDHRTGERRNVSIYPDNPSGHGAEDLLYRFQWTAPIAVSPFPPYALYHGANVLFESEDGGQSWKAISPDLTRNDKSKQKWSGGPITGDNTGVEIYDTIFVIAESPLEKGVIWVGSDDGLVHVTRDGGATWQDVTAGMAGIPEWGTVAMIEPSHFDAGTAWVVIDAHRLDDTRPYLYETIDYGKTWKRLDGGLPRDVYLHTVRQDPVDKDLLYLGTERGVAFSRDAGATWHALRLNLPTVAVSDLAISGRSLAVGTIGRSIWIFDDLPVLRQLSADAITGDVHLFDAPDAVRWAYHYAHKGEWAGDNPPRGAFVYYFLKKKPEGEVKLEILDPSGTVVNTLTSEEPKPIGTSEYVKEEKEALGKLTLPKEEGINRAVWDFSWAGAELIPGAILDAGYPALGPTALPGSYTLRLTVGDHTETTSLVVAPDPRLEVPRQDLEEQLRFSLEVRDAITTLTRTVERLRQVRGQLAERDDLLAGDAAAEPLVEASKELVGKLDDLEAKLHNPKAQVLYDILAMRGGAQLYSRLSPLFDWAKNGNGAPTEGMRTTFAQEKGELEGYRTQLDTLLSDDLAALNVQARQLGLPTIWVPPAR